MRCNEQNSKQWRFVQLQNRHLRWRFYGKLLKKIKHLMQTAK